MIDVGEEYDWLYIASPLLSNTIIHPIEYAKVLMQIGYEPIPPRQTCTLFGRPVLALPNIFKYVKHIRSVNGFTGCYQGIIPKLCALSLSKMAMLKTERYITFAEDEEKKTNKDAPEEEEEEDAEMSLIKCLQNLIRDLTAKIVGIIVSHPLDVIAVRMMAQFVGGENKYNGLFRSVVEVYKENGFAGYYAGIVPRIIGNAGAIILASSCTYLLNKYVITDNDLRTYTVSIAAYIAPTIMYPFNVVTRCMQVNNCGLMAGLPPQMPIYNSWLDCWSHLKSTNQLKRGSNVLWRYYTGPQMKVNGKLVAINNYNAFAKSVIQ